MYLGRTLLIAGSLYFAVHFITGYLYCADNFCPGDREKDYVYAVKDEDGKTWYIDDGKLLSEEDYKKEHQNWVNYREKKDDKDGTKK
jgi:hypothetical protein